MHYKNGRPAHNGDKMMIVDGWNAGVSGILYDAVAGNDYCNGKVAAFVMAGGTPNLKECYHLDDVRKAIAFYEEHIATETAAISAALVAANANA